MPATRGTERLWTRFPLIYSYALRASYYTSFVGDDQALQTIREGLWKLGFDAHAFKKARGAARAKGVDVALTKDMLSHAFRGNYESAVLVAGDGDYLPLVEEVKRLGKQVHIWFFEGEGLSPDLKLSADVFFDLTNRFIDRWKNKANEPVPP